MSSERRPIERYVRASVDILPVSGAPPVGSVELGSICDRGCELRSEMRAALRDIGQAAIRKVRPHGGEFTEAQADELTDVIERAMTEGGIEAWFVEIWDAHEALTQVYAPYGMPRTR